jgi:hypothetical protein
MPQLVLRREFAALAFAALLAPASTIAQLPVAAAPAAGRPVTEANYRLAARFAPYKMRNLVYSLGVTPRWIKGGERFWYEWETAEGKRFMIVDPVAGTRKQLFDNDRIAAESRASRRIRGTAVISRSARSGSSTPARSSSRCCRRRTR